MSGHSSEATREIWRRRMERYSRSGRSVVRFCAGEGVSVASFYYWRKKLKAGPRRRPVSGPPTFRPVAVVPAASTVSVYLPGGARIEVDGHDLNAVRTVVAEVTQANGPGTASSEGRSPVADGLPGDGSC